jgi:hypothetical protein
MALKELRHMRTLTAAVREFKRKNAIEWATNMRSTTPADRPCSDNPICDKATLLSMFLVPVPQTTKKLHNKKMPSTR